MKLELTIDEIDHIQAALYVWLKFEADSGNKDLDMVWKLRHRLRGICKDAEAGMYDNNDTEIPQ